MSLIHTPVLLEAAVEGLNLSPGDKVIDGTFGAGGHAKEIIKRIGEHGRLLAFDKDPAAIKEENKSFKRFNKIVTFINDSYSKLESYAEHNKFYNVAGVLLDLGFSSTQLADYTRGFSFQVSGPLDLRYNPNVGISAAEILNTYSATQLEQIFKNGEEPTYRRLTKEIIEVRRQQPFETTDDLLSVVKRIKGSGGRSLHPATLVWQALRLAVNHELEELEQGLTAAVKILDKGGRLVVISFHSGEDRIVKNFIRQESRECICPPELPDCRCGHIRTLKIITKKSIKPTVKEIKANPRARSARLRIAQKI